MMLRTLTTGVGSVPDTYRTLGGSLAPHPPTNSFSEFRSITKNQRSTSLSHSLSLILVNDHY